MTEPVSLLEEQNVDLNCTPMLTLRVNEQGADEMALLFKALSHPVRVQMLDLIAQGGGQLCGCDIEYHFKLTQPTISHHLKLLRDAGLIVSEARGVSIYHRIHQPVFARARAFLAHLTGDESP
jgi:ArsR family transcriptional regulator